MGRDVDDRKKRAALRKLRKAAQLAEQGLGPPLSDWERQFLEEVEERIETYGSAFADPEKGNEGEALSALQQVKLKEIDKKARGKARKGFKQSKGFKPKKGFGRNASSPRIRQIDEPDIESAGTPESPDLTAPPRPTGPPVLRVITGGRSSEETQ